MAEACRLVAASPPPPPPCQPETLLTPQETASAAAAYDRSQPIESAWQLRNALARLRICVSSAELADLTALCDFSGKIDLLTFRRCVGACKEKQAAFNRTSSARRLQADDEAAVAGLLDSAPDSVGAVEDALKSYGLSSGWFGGADVVGAVEGLVRGGGQPATAQDDGAERAAGSDRGPASTLSQGEWAGREEDRPRPTADAAGTDFKARLDGMRVAPPPKQLLRILTALQSRRGREHERCAVAAEQLWQSFRNDVASLRDTGAEERTELPVLSIQAARGHLGTLRSPLAGAPLSPVPDLALPTESNASAGLRRAASQRGGMSSDEPRGPPASFGAIAGVFSAAARVQRRAEQCAAAAAKAKRDEDSAAADAMVGAVLQMGVSDASSIREALDSVAAVARKRSQMRPPVGGRDAREAPPPPPPPPPVRKRPQRVRRPHHQPRHRRWMRRMVRFAAHCSAPQKTRCRLARAARTTCGAAYRPERPRTTAAHQWTRRGSWSQKGTALPSCGNGHSARRRPPATRLRARSTRPARTRPTR
eukprot:TRINITY_DN2025_c1_g1_i2.p1 TRINITY_DN2025_c1_g1~~TRINITY_DN2025_c1_g1_i2.p1  ORF type:complete len:548 (+),score=179.28 TRINITY_DN2025_c1_g1_i2:35-1645(+)